jgi:hypothetical protein
MKPGLTDENNSWERDQRVAWGDEFGFDVPPLLIKMRVQKAVKAQHREPALAGHSPSKVYRQSVS